MAQMKTCALGGRNGKFSSFIDLIQPVLLLFVPFAVAIGGKKTSLSVLFKTAVFKFL